MFETAEVGNAISREAYDREAPGLRTALLSAQKRLAVADLSAVLVVGGVEGAGKSETVNLLLKWMDPRGIQTHAFWEPTDEERQRPPMWRFWRALPPRGRMGIYFGSWYTQPIIDRVFGRAGPARFGQALERIAEFESMLRHEGVLLVKFWMHLSRAAQKRRLEALRADPRQSWRVSRALLREPLAEKAAEARGAARGAAVDAARGVAGPGRAARPGAEGGAPARRPRPPPAVLLGRLRPLRRPAVIGLCGAYR
jgi:polyphosphate kinase 2 (PPK2 family)